MRSTEVLADGFARFPDLAAEAVDGLDATALRWRPTPEVNPMGWLVWHLTRVQDDHVAEVAGDVQVWTAGGWAPRFGLPDGARDTGFRHDLTQVATVVPEGPDVLVRYLADVTDRTLAHLTTWSDEDLDRVVDTSYDPPVTLGTRLVSVVDDCSQHLGQAAYLRTLWEALGR